MKPPRPSLCALGLALVVAGGAALRFFHLAAGLPDVPYVDAFKFVGEARRMIDSGDLAPASYQYPGFFTNLLALLYGAGGVKSTFAAHLVARCVAAIFGTALIALTYLAARRLCSRGGALLAAALGAGSIVLVTASRIPATDCIVSCFMLGGVWMLAREKPRLRHLLLAGVFLGLAAGTKFTGLYLAAFIALAIAIHSVRSRALAFPASGVAICAVLALLVLVVTTPWIFARFGQYGDRFAFELQIQRHGQIGRVQNGFFDYFISATPTWEMPWLGTSILYTDGLFILIAGLAGCLGALSGRFGAAPLLHSLYVLLYLALACRPGALKAVRFLAPILPSLYIAAAFAVERSLRFVPPRARTPLFGAAALLLLFIPARRSLDYAAMTRREPTEIQTARWIGANIPKNSALFVAPLFLNNLDPDAYRIAHIPEAGMRQYRVPGKPPCNTELAPIYDARLMADLADGGVQYVITNSYYDDAFSPVRENLSWFPRSTAGYRAWLAELHRRGRLLHEIKGYSARHPGPDVRIYQLQ